MPSLGQIKFWDRGDAVQPQNGALPPLDGKYLMSQPIPDFFSPPPSPHSNIGAAWVSEGHFAVHHFAVRREDFQSPPNPHAILDWGRGEGRVNMNLFSSGAKVVHHFAVVL